MEKCTLLLFVIGKKMKFTNEYALLLTLVFSIFSALLLSILLLLCCIRKFGPEEKLLKRGQMKKIKRNNKIPCFFLQVKKN